MCATCAIMYDRTAKNMEVLCGTVFFIVSKDFSHCNAFLVPSGAKRARHGACQSRQPRQTASQWFFLPQTALSRLFPPFLSAFLPLPNVQCRLSCPTIFCTLLRLSLIHILIAGGTFAAFLLRNPAHILRKPIRPAKIPVQRLNQSRNLFFFLFCTRIQVY